MRRVQRTRAKRNIDVPNVPANKPFLGRAKITICLLSAKTAAGRKPHLAHGRSESENAAGCIPARRKITVQHKEKVTLHELRAPSFIDAPARNGAALDLAPESTYDVPEYLDKREAAKVVGLAEKTIERAILRGELRAFKPAGRVRIRRADLNQWIESIVLAPTVHDI
jgi:excisionase family DNA binding protein